MAILNDFIMPFLFIFFAILAVVYHVLSLHDAYEDKRATEWARTHNPTRYRRLDELTARDLVRNEWYRLSKTLLISFIAVFSWTAPPPRPEIVAAILWVAVVLVVVLLWFSAYHERRSKQSIRARVKQEKERQEREH